MDLNAAQQAFEANYQQDPRDGLTVTASTGDGELRVEVRHLDADGETRGFTVVAQPTEGEDKSAEDVGRDVAEVVERELAYGQLPARGEDGEYRRIVV
ncbi:hypothetical protein SAMN04488058_10263 [Deinococcus reticulitermitis]|uniref:Uncharacterized protein n=1 Tax=Deinococcus reticulitermitis TaxID=856736 RepID=A0A1H6U0S0_9DEIO|nr:hypothetical protein [Deinococcus reticulitermitis]SEI85909.1 hypothetical protein SAMN04488058_10263 [Deinococcus reticulitermitis]